MCVYINMFIYFHSFTPLIVFSIYYEPYNILRLGDTKVNKTDRRTALEEFAV